MGWYSIFYLLPLMFSGVLALVVATLAWQRSGRGARLMTLMMAAMALWSLSYVGEVIAVEPAVILLWSKIEYIGIAAVPPLWFLFARAFTDQDDRLQPLHLGLLAISPVLTSLLAWTNEYHGWLWPTTPIGHIGPFPVLTPTHGFWFWIHSAFSYVMIIMGTVLFLRTLLRRGSVYKAQAVLLAVSVVAPLVANGIYIFDLLPFPILDPTPFAFTVSGSALGWALLRYRFLELIPVARRRVFEVIHDAVIVFDQKNRVIDVNPATERLLQRRPAELIGQPAEALFAWWPDLISQTAVSVTQTAQHEVEYRPQPDGPAHFFELSLTSIQTRTGRRQGQLLVLHDITDRKAAEAQIIIARDRAIEASELKSGLLAKVSHELRTPLGVIIGYADLIAEQVYGPVTDKQSKALNEIVNSSQFLNKLVGELLDQAQLDAGRLKLDVRPFALSEITEAVQTKMTVLARAKGLDFSIDLDPHLPTVLEGDPLRVQQILINLLGNAIKFTPAGAVTVRLFRPDDTRWAISVTDTGPGIAPDIQTRIFEPFGQADNSLTRHHQGVGLGLSIVKQLALLMGGDIRLESTVGQGSTFTVTLPLVLNGQLTQ